MENVKKIEELFKASNSIIDGIASYEKEIKDPRCDKFDMGFNKSDKFSASKGVLIRVDSWTGYYGNSGCSTKLSFDNDIFATHFKKVLNKHFKELMIETATSIRNEATEYKDEALAELNKKLESVNSL